MVVSFSKALIMITINSLDDVEKFFDAVWQRYNSIISDLIVENNYHKNDLENISDYIKRYLNHCKKDMVDEIYNCNKYSIPEDEFMFNPAKEFEGSIQAQDLFRSILLFNSNQVLKEIIQRINRSEYGYSK